LNNFSLTIIGSSGAVPAHGRFPSCQYLVVQNRHFLIDCGEGAQIQLTRFDVPIQKIQCIFISHLHGDHYLGLMGLLFSMHLQKRQANLHLYSPRGLNEIILLQLKHSNSSLNYKIIFHPFDPNERNILFEDGALTVETIPLNHRLPCAGFLFKEKTKPRRIDKDKLFPEMLLQHIVALKSGSDIFSGNGSLLYKNKDFTLPPKPSFSYAYCSDTAWNEKMAEQIRSVNLLYHEATFMEDELDKAIKTNHSTARQAAEMAKLCGAERLLMGHFSARYRELEALLVEATAVFPNTALAIEGQTFNLEE
jgi:ribonuclease Z